MKAALAKLSRRAQVALAIGLWLLVTIGVGVVAGTGTRNDEFKPQNEFKLDNWIPIKLGPLDLSINKAVLYIFMACALTVFTMVWIANRMQQRPNRVQTAIEAIYGLMRDNITRDNLDPQMAAKWFPFIGAIFLFIWFSNLIGYLPLPTNTLEKVNIFGLHIPAFALYAATANLSVPLVLALVVWLSYNFEGLRRKGLGGYLKALVPDGVPGPLRPFIFVLECFSQFMRLVSLSVRLFANILAGHLIILFMAGALAVILGIAIYIFEIGLVATLQAFIFATLTAIYLGEAAAAHH